ncbi:GNAT family N-acetyltransferase [Flavobacteriales bacterium]|nr:GNAT family N-acetyltransferase [Flavobacteriales bacterium]
MAGLITYEFSRITSGETWPLRAAVLWPEKEAGPSCRIPTDDLPGTFHFGIRCGNELVSIGSFVPEQKPELPGAVHYRLRAMATGEGHRKRGVGRMLIEGAISALAEKNCTAVWADARHVALGFYARLDWDVIGQTYEVPLRGPHRMVWRRI